MKDVFVLSAVDFDSGEHFTVIGGSEDLCKVWVAYVATKKWHEVHLHTLHNPVSHAVLAWFTPETVKKFTFCQEAVEAARKLAKANKPFDFVAELDLSDTTRSEIKSHWEDFKDMVMCF